MDKCLPIPGVLGLRRGLQEGWRHQDEPGTLTSAMLWRNGVAGVAYGDGYWDPGHRVSSEKTTGERTGVSERRAGVGEGGDKELYYVPRVPTLFEVVYMEQS